MSREIKFRAWVVDGHDDNDKPIWTMIPGDSLAFEEYAPLCHLLQDKEGQAYYMQFTGLKDKNGKDIYEGDILDFEESEWGASGFKSVVEWDTKSASWDFGGGLASDVESYRQVIGNIYEHKELLSTTDDSQQ